MRELIPACAKEGYGEYRTHILFAYQVARTYGWGDQALRKFNKKIKDALDQMASWRRGGMAFGQRRIEKRGGRFMGKREVGRLVPSCEDCSLSRDPITARDSHKWIR